MARIIASELAATGRSLTGLFQMFEAGKIGQLRAPRSVGGLPPAAAGAPPADAPAARGARPRQRRRLPARCGGRAHSERTGGQDREPTQAHALQLTRSRAPAAGFI